MSVPRSRNFSDWLTPMPRNCVFFVMHALSQVLFMHSLQTAPISHISRLAQPCAILAPGVHVPVYFREYAWSLRHGLLAVFTLVCFSHLHGWSAREALLLLIYVACGSYIAVAYPPSCKWGLLAIVHCLPALHAGATIPRAHPCCRQDRLPIWQMKLPLL